MRADYAAAGHVLPLATCGVRAFGAVGKAHLILSQEITGSSPVTPAPRPLPRYGGTAARRQYLPGDGYQV